MMKRIFTLSLLMFFCSGLFAQHSYAQSFTSQSKTYDLKKVDFDGQWKGNFDEGSFGVPGYDDGYKYVLELTTEGSHVSGYSYTYFNEGPNRYFTICRLNGTLNRQTNDLVVTEVERTKYNTPPNFQNCFQTHRLHYERDSGMEVLRGTWIPAPNQQGGCGSGTTVLSRRIVNSMPLGYMPRKLTPTKPATRPATKPVAKAPATKKPMTAPHKKVIAAAPKKNHPSIRKAPIVKKPIIQKPDRIESLVTKKDFSDSKVEKPETISPTLKGFEPRRKDIVKTIAITQPTFKLDFYDNGEIDGDSISVFYNGKVVLSHQRLSDKPISLTLSIDKNARENIVTMYADNLGTIPPNTALMVVTDGSKRYEVRMESDTTKSGSVVFKSPK
jgi:hypothetical protein